MQRYFLVCFIFVMASHGIVGQIYPFRNYGLVEGLPESHVRSIIETHDGFLWLGTEGGICRFDGMNFIEYTTEHGIPSNNVNFILEDRNLHLWIATRAGVSHFDGRIFQSYTTKQGLISDDVYHILEDRKGNLWFATTGGLSRYDGKQFTNYTTKDGLPGNQVWYLYQDSEAYIWIATSSGLARFDGRGFRVFTEADGLPSNVVNCIIEDTKGNLWLGTSNGLARIDKRGTLQSISLNLPDRNIFAAALTHDHKLWFGSLEGAFSIVADTLHELLSVANGLISNEINVIYQDRNHNLWFGTEAGLSKLANRRFNILTQPFVTGRAVTSILQDFEGHLWFGTLGNGLVQYKLDNSFRVFTKQNGLPSNYIRTLYQSRDGSLWIGTAGGGFGRYQSDRFTVFNNPDTRIDDYVYCITEDNEGNIWLGTDYGLLRFDGQNVKQYTTQQGLPSNYIRAALTDGKGYIWLGTYKGLSRFDGRRFVNFTVQNGLANNLVLALYEDHEGNLWVATENGLCRMHADASPEQPNCFTCYGKKDKLSAQNVWSIIEDNEGNLWIGHRNGIEKFDRQKQFKYYGYIDGFKLIQTYPNAVARDREGNLWFGAFNGVVKYNPKEDRPNLSPPITHITSIKLFGKEVDWQQYADTLHPFFNIPLPAEGTKYSVELPYDQNYITFEFIGIHFTIPERVRYQYRLLGFEKNWVEWTTQQKATYTNLPPGKYTFQVRAANSDGIENKIPTEFSFIITPPYWEQWWFYSAQIIFFLTLLLASIYFGTRRRGHKLSVILAIVTLLIVFEFINENIIEGYIEKELGDVTIFKVIANVILAAVVNPLEKLIHRVLSAQEKKQQKKDPLATHQQEENLWSKGGHRNDF